MLTQIEKLRQENRDYTKILTEESLGKFPSYFVTSSSTLASQTKLKAFYFRVEAQAVVTFTNDRTGQTITSKTLGDNKDYWGDFSTITVASGELLVYVK